MIFNTGTPTGTTLIRIDFHNYQTNWKKKKLHDIKILNTSRNILEDFYYFLSNPG